ncbi:MAG: energy-coupling factor ABC transporter permease [Kiritimatiellia bacterium]
MHLESAFISTTVGLSMWGLSATSLGLAVPRIKKDSLPLMLSAGAFVFGAQMMNYAIPGTGSSGHLVGTVFLTALLGPWAALSTMAIILWIQCVGFNDGGLLAYGCNLFNMGIIGCLCGTFLFRKHFSPFKTMLCSVGASIVAVQLGALAVCGEVAVSGINSLHLADFIAAMQPIHLALGIGEGLITGMLLVAVQRKAFAWKPLTATFALAALVLIFGLSSFASERPDGLEWSIERATLTR